MGVVVKGGLVKITGQGSTSTGPRIPTQGLVMVIDPALAQTTSSAYRLITPLTSSVITATTDNIRPGGTEEFVGLRAFPYPTASNTFVYVNTGSNGTFTAQGTANMTYIDVTGSALAYLRNNVQNDLTIITWYSGIAPAITYPQVPSDALPYYKFGLRLNVSPSPIFPVASQATTTLPSSQMMVGASSYGASVNRLWNASALATPAYATTSSLTITTHNAVASANVGWGYGVPRANQTVSADPTYTSHPAVPNPPTWHRLLPLGAIKGRQVYSDNDGWNCIAYTIKQTDKAISSSIYINGGLFASQSAVTSSLTAGVRSAGSTTSFPHNITNNNLDTFYFTGSVLATLGAGGRIQIIPTASGVFPDSTGYPQTSRMYYCASGSTLATTMQNVVDKINNTTELRAFFTASIVGTTGIAVSSSVPGISFNNQTFYFSSSAQGVNQLLFTMAGGVASAGSGPITTTLLAPQPDNPYNSCLRIGAYETAPQTGRYRGGLIGLLGATYIYNRVLSQDEVIQVYNALKSKYGNTTPGNTPKKTYRIINNIVSSSAGITEDPPSSSGIGY